MTFNLDHIHTIGRYRQGQHTLMTSRSQGQSQGHEGHFRFLAVFTRFRELLSFDRRVLKTLRNVLCDHTQKINAAEF